MVVSTSNRYPLRFCEILCLFFLIGYITFLGTIACNSGVASICVHTQISLILIEKGFSQCEVAIIAIFGDLGLVCYRKFNS